PLPLFSLSFFPFSFSSLPSSPFPLLFPALFSSPLFLSLLLFSFPSPSSPLLSLPSPFFPSLSLSFLPSFLPSSFFL
ncbi:hypothetical protein ACXWRS_12470, partial [Streptococcus pyogenes]